MSARSTAHDRRCFACKYDTNHIRYALRTLDLCLRCCSIFLNTLMSYGIVHVYGTFPSSENFMRMAHFQRRQVGAIYTEYVHKSPDLFSHCTRPSSNRQKRPRRLLQRVLGAVMPNIVHKRMRRNSSCRTCQCHSIGADAPWKSGVQ